MTKIEKVLCKLFNHIDITDGTGEVYMRRWFIYPRKPERNKQVGRIYLHRFIKSDNLRDLHDHPWAFTSFILWGGYYEHRLNPSYEEGRYYPKTIRTWYGPFSKLKRGARWTHAVELPYKSTAWTLFFTGVKERSWGFHTPKGWCWHRNYENGVCWCYDNPNETKEAV